MINPNALKKGHVASFNYSGGTNPGSLRTVYVLDADYRSVKTWDFQKEEIRNFHRNRMSNVAEPKDGVITDVSMLPSTITPAIVIDGFKKDGYRTYRDGDVLICVRVKPIVPVYTIRSRNMFNGTLCVDQLKDGRIEKTLLRIRLTGGDLYVNNEKATSKIDLRNKLCAAL